MFDPQLILYSTVYLKNKLYDKAIIISVSVAIHTVFLKTQC